MALDLHMVLSDGSVTHEPFTKEGWERALKDPRVVDRWGHRPEDCHDPLDRVGARIQGAPAPAVKKVQAQVDRVARSLGTPRDQLISELESGVKKLKKILVDQQLGLFEGGVE